VLASVAVVKVAYTLLQRLSWWDEGGKNSGIYRSYPRRFWPAGWTAGKVISSQDVEVQRRPGGKALDCARCTRIHDASMHVEHTASPHTQKGKKHSLEFRAFTTRAGLWERPTKHIPSLGVEYVTHLPRVATY
jgi:peptidase E